VKERAVKTPLAASIKEEEQEHKLLLRHVKCKIYRLGGVEISSRKFNCKMFGKLK
jgi:hypothetical protein